MPNQFTENTFASVYKDSFRDSDGYYKVLFNSGVPLQARELNELQTILQRQLAIFGKNVFKEGAAVNPNSGAIRYGSIDYVRIETPVSTPNWSALVGVTLSGTESNGTTVRFVVDEVLLPESGSSDNITLYGTKLYDEDGSESSKSTTPTFSAGEEISNGGDFSFTVAPSVTVNAQTIAPTGQGFFYAIDECDFFIKGYFVRATKQRLILSKYTDQEVTANIGFECFRDIITVQDDENLYDNQGPVPNRAAPGADRFRIRLQLATDDTVTDVDNFVEFARIRNSELSRQKQDGEDYNQPEKRDAERHYITHGNFISKPYKLQFSPGSSANTLNASVYDGQCFVNGIYNSNILKKEDFEALFDTTTTEDGRGPIPKPISTFIDTDSAALPSFYGNYVLADSGADVGFYDGIITGTGPLAPHRQHYLFIKGSPNTLIGKCYVRSGFKDLSGSYRFYLYDVKMEDGYNFRQVERIAASTDGTTDYFDPRQTDGQLFMQDAGNNSLVFPLPAERAKETGDINFTVMRQFTANVTGGQITINTSSGDVFEDPANWVLINQNTDTTIKATNASITTNTATLTLSGVVDGHTITVLAKVRKTNEIAKSKTLDSAVFDGVKSVDSDGVNAVTFASNDAYDGYKLESVWYMNGADSVDLAPFITFDNGQRDNFYKKFRLIVNNDNVVPSSGIKARVKYFSWGATGSYFSVNSYDLSNPAVFGYKDIPAHTFASGEKIYLYDALDFRSKYRSTNAADYIEVPPGGTDTFIFDYIEYYNQRIDLFCVAPNTELISQTIIRKQGTEAQPNDLKTPPVPGGALPLFAVRYNGNTLSTQDLTITPYRHNRYTMADIQKLEERVATVEETTALSFLENQTQALSFTDTQGNLRLKTGTFVDNFLGGLIRTGSEISAAPEIGPERSTFSLNRRTGRIHPKIRTEDIRLLFDSDGNISQNSQVAKQNVVRRGDSVYLEFTQVQDPSLRQELVSGGVNVNPFNVFTGRGRMTLTPSTDFWMEKRRIPDNIIDGGTEINRVLSPDLDDNFDWWQFGWQGDLPLGTNLTTGNRFGFGATRFTSGREPTGRTRFRVTSTNFTGGALVGGSGGTFQQVENATVGVPEREVVRVRDTLISDEIRLTPAGERTIVAISIPWMRSRLVHFKAEGLRPNTLYFPFFDGIRFDQWVKLSSEQDFVRYSETRTAESDARPDLQRHPDYGESTSYDSLLTDENGILYGTLWIPNNAPLPSEEQLGFTTEQEWLEWVENWSALSESNSYTGSKDPTLYDQIGWKFRIGDITFKLLDISVDDEDNTLSYARATYSSKGSMEVVQADVLSTRVLTFERTGEVRWERDDPLAQTFLIDEALAPKGVFISSVDVFLLSWPELTDLQVPLQLQIRGVRDGTPRTESFEQLTVYKSAADVRDAVSGLQNRRLFRQGDGTEENPNKYPGYTATVSDVIARPVNFEFEEPVYLAPNTEYAIVLLAETDTYEAAIAKTYSFYLNDTTKRISKQPANGSLFLSQNSSTWTPDQTSDLAYRIYTAKFKNSGQFGLYNADVSKRTHLRNSILTTNASNTIVVRQPGHSLGAGDHPNITGFDSATRYNGIFGATIMNPNNTVDSADYFNYSIVLDSAATATGPIGGDGVSSNRNVLMDRISFSSTDVQPIDTNLSYTANFTTGFSHAKIDFSVVGDTRFADDTNSYNLVPTSTIMFRKPNMVANPVEEQSSLGLNGKKSVRISASMSTDQVSNFGGTLATTAAVNGYVSDVSPVADLQNKMLIGINHVIDNQDSSGAQFGAPTYANSPLNFVSESTGSGQRGSSLSKWISKPVQLPSISNGLRVFVEAYVPPEANIDFWWRSSVEDGSVFNNAWQRVEPEGDAPSKAPFIADPNASLPLAPYSYLIGGLDGFDSDAGLDFSEFQIKIVMRTTNTCQAPVIDNVRAIALL